MFRAFLISETSLTDVSATGRRAEETGRQLKETSGFESYLADLFVFNRAVSIFVRTL